jgi:hypothetical protein
MNANPATQRIHGEDNMSDFPKKPAIIPTNVSANAIPSRNKRRSQARFRLDEGSAPAMWPTTRGIADNAHGLADVSTPAMSAYTGPMYGLDRSKDLPPS